MRWVFAPCTTEASVNIKTTRFGELEIKKSDIIQFKEGILGFENLKKFFVVDPGDQTLILWFQSVEDPTVAFPIIEPKIFLPDYRVKLLPAELASLEIESVNDASVFTILTIPQIVTDMSANLKAPIVINNKTKLARQIVLQDSKLEVRYKMYMDLKKYIVSYSSDDSSRTRTIIEAADVTPEEVTVTIETPTVNPGKQPEA